MPRKLIPNRIKREFQRLTQQVVLDLSQPLVIIQESPFFVDCPNCIWDSINKKSSNVFDASFTVASTIFVGTDQQRTISPVSFTSGRCPVCVGEGQLFTEKELCIPAMINFIRSGDGSEYMDLAAGKEGVNYAVVKTLACYYDLLARNEVFVIHRTIKCEKFKPPFVRGMGGLEAVAEMIVQTTESGQRSTGKFDVDDPKFNRLEDVRRRIKGPTATQILRGPIKGQGG
jgi:hypothetical protein